MARPEGNGNGCGGDPVDRFANEHATLPIPAINQNTGQQTEHEVGKTISAATIPACAGERVRAKMRSGRLIAEMRLPSTETSCPLQRTM